MKNSVKNHHWAKGNYQWGLGDISAQCAKRAQFNIKSDYTLHSIHSYMKEIQRYRIIFSQLETNHSMVWFYYHELKNFSLHGS